jgi:hypothetical protein
MTDSTGKLTYRPNNIELFSNAANNANAGGSATGATANTITYGGSQFWGLGTNTAPAQTALIISVKLSSSTLPNIVLRDSVSGALVLITLTSTPTQYSLLIPAATRGVATTFAINLDNRTGFGASGGAGVLNIGNVSVSAVTYETTPRQQDQQITTSAAYFGPVQDFDPVTLANKGLRIWQAATNLALWSRDLTNAAWTVSALSSTAKDQTGPDGVANSASSFTAGAVAATVSQIVAHASSTDNYSVYLKRITGTGVVSVTLDGVTYTDVTSQINSSTWSRVTISQTALVNPAFGIKLATSGDKIGVDLNQLESGVAFPSPPIPTTTASVSSAADVATIATSSFPFSATTGMWVASYLKSGTNYNGDVVGYDVNNAALGVSAGNAVFAYDTTNFNTLSNAAINNFALTKAGSYYSPGKIYLSANGLISASQTWLNPTTTKIGIGINGSGNSTWLNGWVSREQFYTSGSPARLQQLTGAH